MPDKEDSSEVMAREIIAAAEKKAKRTLRNAGRRAENLKRRAQRDVERTVREAGEAARQRAERRERITKALTSVEAKRLALSVREKLFDEILKDAAGRVAAMKPEQKAEMLVRLTLDSAREIPADDIVITIPQGAGPQVAERISREVTAALQADGRKVRIEVTEGSVTGGEGILAQSRDGRLRVDNTLQRRLERLKPQLRTRIAKILLGKTEDDA